MSILATSCAKDDPATPAPVAPASPEIMRVAHVVDGLPLTYDTLLYTNEAGTTFSVSRVEYYLSELVLIGSGGTANDTLHGPWYVNAAGTTDFELTSLRTGTYSGATMLLGLPPELNLTDSLPNTIENINMAWPVPMGGGYHFIKFEGHFLADSAPHGFAMHIGRNAFLPHCEMPQGFTITGGGGKLLLTFNLNEVFRSPHTYDLASGNYSMGSAVLMGQLRDNCANSFTIAYEP
ncbi:MAG: hypothetical protein KDC01_13395 [Flavobacteriales bacterium]|nr:hypothetical protein [Flavobacteriales bacterium]